MNKTKFIIQVVLMSLSLIGIILVQLYWISSSYKNNEEQFKYHIQQVIGNVAEKLQQDEIISFYKSYEELKKEKGKNPIQSDFREFSVIKTNKNTNETFVYSSTIISEDFGINLASFDKNLDNSNLKSFSAKQKTQIFNSKGIDKTNLSYNPKPEISIEEKGRIDELDKIQFRLYYNKYLAFQPINERISKDTLQKYLTKELKKYEIKTPFEFGIYSNNLATKVKSDSFKYLKENTYNLPIFNENETTQNKYALLVSFPKKEKFLFSSLTGITLLSLLFTLIIIIAYANTLRQLILQKQISEIKTDFINNMTHEFKTPIATINLALDAIKNPKIIDKKEMVLKYLQMIKDENKRMHAQVENVLRISKLEKNEIDITKEPIDIHDVIEVATEHVQLIIEDRNGTIHKQLQAQQTTALLNDVHFTNVLVNMLDNAIKYSPDEPKIEIITENVKDFLLIKIKDKGIGMSKAAQKHVFDKFYREHTGDIHNVKGHGLGLAYVKQIVEAHNGEVFVESEKGKGSTFTIKLPVLN